MNTLITSYASRITRNSKPFFRAGAFLTVVLAFAVSEGMSRVDWEWRNLLPNGNLLTSVTYGDGTYVAVDFAGTVVTSTNGADWERYRSGTREHLRSVTWNKMWFEEKLGEEYFEDPVRSAPHADPDGRGISNLVRYAFDLNPTTPDHRQLPKVESVELTDEEARYLTVSYTRRADHIDLVYEVQASDDLDQWVTLGDEHVIERVPDSDRFVERVTVRDELPISGEARRYMRVNVRLNAEPSS